MSPNDHIAAKLQQALAEGRVPAQSRQFAADLLRKRGLYGEWTGKQAFWAAKFANAGRPEARDVNVRPVVELLATARDRGLKNPAIEIGLADHLLRLSLAKEHSANPGYVYLKVDKEYAGKISPAGDMSLVRELAVPAEQVADRLRALGDKPAEVAAKHGHETGQCCFCSRRLDDARSTTVGYGPICADRYDLPWGGA